MRRWRSQNATPLESKRYILNRAMLSQSTNPIQAWLSSVAAAIRARLMHYDPRLPRTVAFLPASAETLHGMDTQRRAARPDEAQEVRQWLHEIQKRAILPLKWTIFVVAAAFWALRPPSVLATTCGSLCAICLVFSCECGTRATCCFSHESRRVRFVPSASSPTQWTSRLSHALSGSIRSDLHARVPPPPIFTSSFSLWSFAVSSCFAQDGPSLLVNGVIGLVFAATLLAQENTTPMDTFRNHAIRVVFFWIVILMSAFIAHLLHLQNKELMRARENLLRSENLALLGQLAAGVAHEVNNPIGIIFCVR